jgi:hypothetical protein
VVPSLSLNAEWLSRRLRRRHDQIDVRPLLPCLERQARRLRRGGDAWKVRTVRIGARDDLRPDGLCAQAADRHHRHDEGSRRQPWDAILAPIIGDRERDGGEAAAGRRPIDADPRGNHGITQVVEHPSGDYGATRRRPLGDERGRAEQDWGPTHGHGELDGRIGRTAVLNG